MFRVLLLCCVVLSGCSTTALTPTQEPQPIAEPYLLHLPGIGGARRVDRRMLAGLVDGGFQGTIELYDWTGREPGLPALTNKERHEREARVVADRLIALRRADPRQTIIITAHSGGTGIAVFALEKLPPEVRVDRVLLLATALSPGYDLTAALRRTDRLYSFWSVYDTAILSVGTSLFGTIDGPKIPAAGAVGFIQPPTADAQQYRKLRQVPYDPAWTYWHNPGLHIGALHPTFAREVLAPLVLGGTNISTTRPATMPLR